MITANLSKLDLTHFYVDNNADQTCDATFPLFGALGSRQTAIVYFELEPGKRLGRHTDSEEEVLLVLDGEIEVTVGDEHGRLGEREMALVPRMLPHDLKNVGTAKARVLGFFGARDIVATFDNVWLPTESNTVDTSQLRPLEASAAE